MPESRSGASFGWRLARRAARLPRAFSWVSPWSAIIWPRGSARSGSNGQTRCPTERRICSECAREGAAVEQDVLTGDEAGLGAAQEGAGKPEFIRFAEAAGGIEPGALGQ